LHSKVHFLEPLTLEEELSPGELVADADESSEGTTPMTVTDGAEEEQVSEERIEQEMDELAEAQDAPIPAGEAEES
jgi:hypothetical protein